MGEAEASESSQKGAKGNMCYKCQGFKHYAYQCPIRISFVDEKLVAHIDDPVGDSGHDM